MDKRFQVFVSSTYQDLQEERQEVMQALLELDCIPSGMELFPAANEDQWTLIKKVIDDCDYYMVFVGGRYGSLGPGGLSYTEMEYRYALDSGKPIIAFLHKDPGGLPANRTEEGLSGKKKLKAFRALAENKVVKYWTSSSDLGATVSRSLVWLIKNTPAIGWIRADQMTMIRSTFRLHVPSTEYPPTDDFDPAFMLDLMDDLSRSSKFWCRESSGKWVGPFINYCRNPPVDTKVIILDPSDESAILQRAADRKRTEKNANRTIDELVEELRHEISMAVVSLYEARHRSNIEIFLSGSTASTVGLNLTDKAVYVGLHVTGPGPAARNPASYRYENNSLAYGNYSVELIRQSLIAHVTITFGCNSNKNNLMDAFKTIRMDNITDDQINELRREVNEFQEEFFTNMRGAAR